METDLGNKKFFSIKFNSKYKSKFADYFGKKGNSSESYDKKKIKSNKTYKYSDKFDKHINFTNLKKKYRALSNKIPLPQSIIKEENIE